MLLEFPYYSNTQQSLLSQILNGITNFSATDKVSYLLNNMEANITDAVASFFETIVVLHSKAL